MESTVFVKFFGKNSFLIPCSRYRTMADRLLNIILVPSRRLVRRDVSYEFMNRQMVWHAFTVRFFVLDLFFVFNQ